MYLRSFTQNKKRFSFAAILLLTIFLTISGVSSRTARAATIRGQLKAKTASIVKKKVKKSDTKKQALKKLFQYGEKTWGYARTIGFQGEKNWEKTYALQMFTKNQSGLYQGSCYHFAAAYGFLAKKATGYPVRIGVGTTNGFNKEIYQPHAWTEVKIGSTWYICDVNLDKFAANSSGKYFLKARSKLKKVYNNFKAVKYVAVGVL